MSNTTEVKQAFKRLMDDGLFFHVLADHPPDCGYHHRQFLIDCTCGRFEDMVAIVQFMDNLEDKNEKHD